MMLVISWVGFSGNIYTDKMFTMNVVYVALDEASANCVNACIFSIVLNIYLPWLHTYYNYQAW